MNGSIPVPSPEEVARLAKDPVDQAIEAVANGAAMTMAQTEIRISSTGRMAVILLPIDITDAEALEVIGVIPGIVRGHHAKADELDPSRKLTSIAGGRLKG